MNEVLVHIGYPKTGTTLLQERFFKQVPEFNAVAKYKGNYPQWLIDFAYADDYYWDIRKESVKKEIEALLVEGKLNIISSEAFTRFGGVSHKLAYRIKELLPQAKILMVVRDPLQVIDSFINYNIQHEGHFLKIDEMIDFGRSPMVHYKRKPVYLPDLFYDEVISLYEKLFSKNHVLVTRYEEMVGDYKSIFKSFSEGLGLSIEPFDFLGAKVNRSIDDTRLLTSIEKNMIQSYVRYGVKITPENIEALQIEDFKVGSLKEEILAEIRGKCYGYY